MTTHSANKQTQEGAHRPAPWRISEHTPTTIKTPRGHISISWTCNFDNGETDQAAKDTAALIVKAVNSHEALRGALSDLALLRQMCDDLPEGHTLDDVNTGINCSLREFARQMADKHQVALALAASLQSSQ